MTRHRQRWSEGTIHNRHNPELVELVRAEKKRRLAIAHRNCVGEEVTIGAAA